MQRADGDQTVRKGKVAQAQLEDDFSSLFADYDTATMRDGALIRFTHIRDNQLFYKTYFKLCYDEKHLIFKVDASQAQEAFACRDLKYHIEFFRNGLNAIIRLWLDGGCEETPEEMAEILRQEYRGR